MGTCGRTRPSTGMPMRMRVQVHVHMDVCVCTCVRVRVCVWTCACACARACISVRKACALVHSAATLSFCSFSMCAYSSSADATKTVYFASA